MNNIILIKVIIGMISGLFLEISGFILLVLGFTGSLDFSISFSNIGINLTTTHIGIGVLLFGVILHIITIRKKFKIRVNDSYTINNENTNDDSISHHNSNSRSESINNNKVDLDFVSLIPLFKNIINDERYNNLTIIDKEYFIRYWVFRTNILSNNNTNHVINKDINEILTEYLLNKEGNNTLLIHLFDIKKSVNFEHKRELEADGGCSVRRY